MIDNYDLWERHDWAMETVVMKRPTCDCCHEHIQDDTGYRIDGKLMCRDCAEEWLDDQAEDIDWEEEEWL